jgi:hypothetical protein
MGVRYATALEAMTRFCDLYREAAASAPAALAEATGGDGMPRPPVPEPAEGDVSPLRTFTEALGRSREANRRRQGAGSGKCAAQVRSHR